MGDDLAVHGHVLTHHVPDGYPSLVTLLSVPVTMMAWDRLGWWTCWQKKMDNWLLLINLSTACHFSQNDWRLIESKERKEERHFCWNKQFLHKLGGIMLPQKSIISPNCRLSRNQKAIYLHLSDLGRGKPFFCHCISGVGEPLVVGIRKRNSGAHSRLSVPENDIKVWISIISMHPHHIKITIMNYCNNSDPLSSQGPAAGKLGTQKINK